MILLSRCVGIILNQNVRMGIQTAKRFLSADIPGYRTQKKTDNFSKMYVGTIDDGVHRWEQVRLGIVGAPFHMGQPHKGVEKAPSEIRQTGLVDRLRELGHDVKDFGDVEHEVVAETGEDEVLKKMLNPLNNISFAKKLSDVVERVISDDRLLLTIGGDHSISLASIFGHLKVNPDMCVLWVDAHADINSPLTSDTGHTHGMPVGFNLKEMAPFQPTLPNFQWFEPLLDANRLAYIGLRDVDPLECSILDRTGVKCYSMREVDELGIREVVKRALQNINPNGNRPIHVSFDIDSLDPSEAPSTGTTVRGGLTLREAQTIMEDCFISGNLRALDLVEVNTSLGNEEEGTKTLQAAKRVILAAMGYYRGGRPPLPEYMTKYKGLVP